MPATLATATTGGTRKLPEQMLLQSAVYNAVGHIKQFASVKILLIMHD